MKVSLSWLKTYVAIEMAAQKLADALTMAGLEVEAVSNRYDYLQSVRVARIVKTSPHPKADKLAICEVDTGGQLHSVVCGAPNAKKMMLTALALPGTQLPGGTVIAKSSLRGITSEGMLCSARELHLGVEAGGIMELDPALTVGAGLAEALDLQDTVFEIGLTPNRADCLSLLGIAREIAAIQKGCVKYPETSIVDTADTIAELASVSIAAPDHCPRYAARLLVDVHVGPSPFWLQDRLMSIGLRPINNIVDITNYVMMETGQPLHAFDFDTLAGHKIIVRTAADGETFTTLDQKERRLTGEMLMICDGHGPVGIAGVMGGLNSEIKTTTTRVLIESACFDPISIRKTAKMLGLNTDASHRFERGVDPQGTVGALNRAALLMAEFSGARMIEGLIDVNPRPYCEKSIRLNLSDTNRVLGTDYDQGRIRSLLESIEFSVENTDANTLCVHPPSYRVDVDRPVDLMEEIARLDGYNNIPTTYPMIPAQGRRPQKALILRDKVKALLQGFGFQEAINYSFTGAASCDQLRFSGDDPRRRLVTILNPLSEDLAVMRTSLLPGLFGSVHRNLAQQSKNIKLFEVGKVFIGSGADELPQEPEMLAGIWTGLRTEASWTGNETAIDFYDIKGLVEALVSGLNIDTAEFARMPEHGCSYTKAGNAAQLLIGNSAIGIVGEVHPQVTRNYDLAQKAFIFELNLDTLWPMISDRKKTTAIPKFPAITRDITLIIDKAIEAGSILDRVAAMNEELVERLHLFDVYEGDPIPPGKKSISFRITYRSTRETLEDEMVTGIHRHITAKLLDAFEANLPG